MEQSKEESAIIFLHIPKAAGTTLRQIIHRQYDPASVLTLTKSDEETDREIRSYSLEHIRRSKIIQGHMPFGLHRHIPKHCTYITMLREPIDRLISFYYYILQNPDNDHYQAVVSQRMSLREYILSGFVEDNSQTRRIAGLVQVSKREAGIKPKEECTPYTLEIAKTNLKEHFSIVGLSERFDETLIIIKRMFGWKLPLYVRVNVTKNRPTKERIPEETLDILKNHSTLDHELFKFGQELFKEQLMKQGASFLVELNAFRFFNRIYDSLHSLPPSVRQVMKSAYVHYRSTHNS